MNKLDIEYVDINSIKPYEKNAKLHPKKQIERIKKSIEEFGFNDPIGVWNNEVIEGHGRLIACKELGFKEVPIIRLDHLTDEERKAYILVHNKLTMSSGFDIDILNEELFDFDTIDMTDFGFNLDFEPKVNERERTNEAYNLEIFDEELTDGKWQMPIIKNDNYIPSDLMGFNYAKTSENKKTGIHFYLDDYQFERIWNNPGEYTDILSQYECILSPDFSLYLDMAMPVKLWNIYRSRLIGQYYQLRGIKVIPTISWAEKDTFEFCFDGIPEGSIVSISTIGVKRDPKAMQIWKEGMDAMIEKIKPTTILVYGGELEYDYKDIKVIYYENKITERMKEIL
ncbi:MAG: DUF4417 domain-containing protein [Methanobrevibacter sp.]|nr:DUF4417 domain-containing protein [Methanobrevibacter sp.]